MFISKGASIPIRTEFGPMRTTVIVMLSPIKIRSLIFRDSTSIFDSFQKVRKQTSTQSLRSVISRASPRVFNAPALAGCVSLLFCKAICVFPLISTPGSLRAIADITVAFRSAQFPRDFQPELSGFPSDLEQAISREIFSTPTTRKIR
jgi:hypothetical protein